MKIMFIPSLYFFKKIVTKIFKTTCVIHITFLLDNAALR